MKSNVLITSAGRRVSLLRAFAAELAQLPRQGEIWAADARPDLSAACQLADGSFSLPRLHAADYIDRLLEACLQHDIGLVVPTLDTELWLLAEARARFAAVGIHIVVSDTPFVNICRDKRQTCTFFHQHDIATPQPIDCRRPTFPLFVKPADGSNSVGARVVHHPDELTDEMMDDPRNMFMAYMTPARHTEFTVDLYYNQAGVLRCVVPRQRLEVRGGEVAKAITRKGRLWELLQAQLRCIDGARGCITAQFFVNHDTQQVFGSEINARFGGGYPLSYAAGANYPRWLLEEYLLGQDIAEHRRWRADFLMLRYDSEVFVDAACG